MPLEAFQCRQNGNQDHTAVLATIETPNGDVIDSNVSNKICTIIAPGKEQELDPTFESRSKSNDASSDPVLVGHTSDNIAVDENAQHERSAIAANDEKHENDYDTDGSIGPFHDAVEC